MAEVMMDSQPFLEPLGISLLARGKVRETYDLGDGKLLIVATDRISAFDVVLPTGIPDKGLVLTQMSVFWFEKTTSIVPNHFVRLVDQTKIPQVPVELPPQLVGRSMVVRKANPISLEAIVRGYITGSGWVDYQGHGSISGIKLPSGLKESQEFFNPIFTPSTKAQEGHDVPITFPDVIEMIGKPAAHTIALSSVDLYKYARDYARERGIIVADTKFEFGWVDGDIILIDECLTPDSSRFWPADQYQSGRPQPSFDKQFVRDYLSDIGWNRKPPVPELPFEITKKTSEKYREAQRLLTGSLI